MHVTAVDSTMLATVAYDRARELLQLEFRSRAIYQYFGVAARHVSATDPIDYKKMRLEYLSEQYWG